MPVKLELFECVVTSRTRWHFVRVETADGAVGFGECSDAGSPREIEMLVEDVLRPFTEVLAHDREPDVIAAAARRAARGSHLARRTVVGGVEQAICDAAARRRGLPLCKWLGGDSEQLVPLYANINRTVGGRAPHELAEAGLRAIADGFTAVKCAPFDSAIAGMSPQQTGIARVAALRAAVGEGIDLMVDCHERVLPADLVPLLPAMAALDVSWLEEAVPASDLAGLKAVREASSMRIAGGEFAADPAELMPAVERRLLDIVMPDVKHAGGLLRAASLAAAVGAVDISPHNPSGPIATAASAHLFAAAPRATVLEFAHGEVDWRADLVFGNETVRSGHLVVAPGPGLGIELDTTNSRLRHVRTITL
jgi:galactonate dehydratase